MASLSDKSVWDEVEDGIGEEVLKMSTEEIVQRTRLLDSEIKIMKSEVLRVTHELQAMKDKIKENTEKIKVNKTLPYLVSNVIELLDVDPNDQEEDGANVDLDSQRKGKCAVIKTSTRQTYFLPVIGLVDAEKLKPGDLVGVNKDSYLILETLPTEYDSRVKAMEVDERPTEQYSDIGGLDKQIQELVEAIVLPMNHKEKFENLGIQPPKGVLMYGPPGTGKTLLARACAAQTKATFLKLAGPQLVQMFIGDGAKLVRDAFALAKEKAPSIIFIDELDAIGTKRFDSEKAGDREVQRTMLELLNQLDGFQPNMQVKVKTLRTSLFVYLFVYQVSPFTSSVLSGNCRHQQGGHPGPGVAALRPSGQKDRVPDAQRGGQGSHHADPLPQDERQPRRQLRGAGPLHRRLQRGPVQGRVRGGGDDRAAARGHRAQPRRLHGGDPGGPGQEEGQPPVLRLGTPPC